MGSSVVKRCVNNRSNDASDPAHGSFTYFGYWIFLRYFLIYSSGTNSVKK